MGSVEEGGRRVGEGGEGVGGCKGGRGRRECRCVCLPGVVAACM